MSEMMPGTESRAATAGGEVVDPAGVGRRRATATRARQYVLIAWSS